MFSQIFEQGAFQVDPNATPDQIKKKREAITRALSGRTNYTGEGLAKLATGIVGGIRGRQFDKFEGEKRAEATEAFESALGGPFATPQTTGTPFAAPAPQAGANDAQSAILGQFGGPTNEAAAATDFATGGGFPASLVRTESGGNWNALNNEVGAGGVRGHGGRLQFGQGRLADAARAGVVPELTPQQFAQSSPEVQRAVENWHFADIDKAIDGKLSGAIGQTINGVPVTRDGLRAVAHLGGTGGMIRFVESGGQYNPSDSFGTSLTDYLGTHAGGGQQGAQVTPAQAPSQDVTRLQQALANPWLNEQQRQVLTGMIGQANQQSRLAEQRQYDQDQFAQRQAAQQNDPLRQIQLQQAQLDLEQSRNGGGANLPSSVVEAQWRAQQAGLQPGSPEYQAFILNGGGDPATYRALEMQAIAGGLVQGTPEFQEFMRSRGAGEQSFARTAGANEANITSGGEAARVQAAGAAQGKRDVEAQAGAPAAIAQAQQGIELIDSIVSDPSLPSITGMVQGRLPPITQAGTDLNEKVKQLQGKAFLQAFESLKGGGAITEREGQAAQNAMARLERSQSTGAYVEALNELKAIMQGGLSRAQGQQAQPAGGALDFGADTAPSSITGDDADLWKFASPEERRAIWGDGQ